MARDWQGRRLVPGVNVDRIDISAGDDEARRLGFDAKERMVITYALARWARGEEEGAEQTLRSHGLLQVTPWRMILAAARAAAEQTSRQQQAAAALAAEFARHSFDSAGAVPDVVETMTGGSAFIAEHNGVTLAVIVTPQTTSGPLQHAPGEG